MEAVNFYHYGGKEKLNETFDHWRYVGRQSELVGLPASPLANPYSVKQYGRDEAIARYKSWLWGKLQGGDDDVIRAMLDIRHRSRLVCWCKPKACHADVIISAWEWMLTPDVYLYQLYDSMLNESDPYDPIETLKKKRIATYQKIKRILVLS